MSWSREPFLLSSLEDRDWSFRLPGIWQDLAIDWDAGEEMELGRRTVGGPVSSEDADRAGINEIFPRKTSLLTPPGDSARHRGVREEASF